MTESLKSESEVLVSRRIARLTAVLGLIAILIVVVSIGSLFYVDLGRQRDRVRQNAEVHARLLQAESHRLVGLGSRADTDQAIQALLDSSGAPREGIEGLGRSAELLVVAPRGDSVHVLAIHFFEAARSRPVPPDFVRPAWLSADDARAITRDDRHHWVVAAAVPVRSLGLWVVVQADLAETAAPYINASLLATALALLLVLAGVRGVRYHLRPLIHELESRERRLREQAYTMEAVIENAPIAIYTLDDEGRVGDIWNPAAERLYSRPRAAATGQPLPEASPEYRAQFPALRARLWEGEVLEGLEFRRSQPDGSSLTLSASVAPIRNADDVVDRAVVLARDVTEEKRQEEQLRHKASLLSQVSDAVIATDPGFRITAWNPAAERLYGWSAEEVIGQVVPELLRTAHVGIDREAFVRQMCDGGFAGPLIHRRKDGSQITVESRATALRNPEGSIIGFLATNRDVSDRRRWEDTLRRYELLSTHTRDIIVFTALDGSIMEANGAALVAYGRTHEAMCALRLTDLEVSGENRGAVPVRREGDHSLYRARHRRGDGSTFPVEVSTVGAVLSGELTVMHVMRDLTERERGEQELQRSRAGLLKAQQIAHLGNWDWEFATGKVTWSDEMYHLFGVTLGEFDGNVGAIIQRQVHPERPGPGPGLCPGHGSGSSRPAADRVPPDVPRRLHPPYLVGNAALPRCRRPTRRLCGGLPGPDPDPAEPTLPRAARRGDRTGQRHRHHDGRGWHRSSTSIRPSSG